MPAKDHVSVNVLHEVFRGEFPFSEGTWKEAKKKSCVVGSLNRCVSFLWFVYHQRGLKGLQIVEYQHE